MPNRALSVAFSDLEQSGAIKLGPIGNRKLGKEGNHKDGAKMKFMHFGFGYKLWSQYEYQRTCRCRQQQLALFYFTSTLTCRSFSGAVRTTTGGFYCFWITEVWTSVIFKPENSSCYFATGGNFLMSTYPLASWTSSVWKNQTVSSLSFFSLTVPTLKYFFFPPQGVFWCCCRWLFSFLVFSFMAFESAVLKEEGLTIWFWEQSASKRHGWFAHHSRPG